MCATLLFAQHCVRRGFRTPCGGPSAAPRGLAGRCGVGKQHRANADAVGIMNDSQEQGRMRGLERMLGAYPR